MKSFIQHGKPGQGILEAKLLVPSHAIGFVEPGDKALLRYQAFPYQKFGHQQDKVKPISRSALNQSELQTLLGMPCKPSRCIR